MCTSYQTFGVPCMYSERKKNQTSRKCLWKHLQCIVNMNLPTSLKVAFDILVDSQHGHCGNVAVLPVILAI